MSMRAARLLPVDDLDVELAERTKPRVSDGGLAVAKDESLLRISSKGRAVSICDATRGETLGKEAACMENVLTLLSFKFDPIFLF